MDYTAIYNALIARSKTRTLTGYVERHHIVPKCLGGLDDAENIAILTPEEHYLAHQLLVKMYPGECRLLSAAMYMCGNRPNNKVYGWLRRAWSTRMRGKNNPYYTHPGTVKLKRGNKRTKFTEREIDALKQRMRGKNNPCSGIDPWNHPRATEKTKAIWADAPWYYEKWKETGWSYHRLAKARGEVPVMTHINMIRRFREGWVPCKL